MKAIFFFVVLLTPFQMSLAETKLESETQLAELTSEASKLSFEANLLAQSIGVTNSPLIGPSAIYRTGKAFSLGARAMLSLGGTSIESAYSFQILQRFDVYKVETTVFIETNESYNQANRSEEFFSVGSSLGLDYPLNTKLGIGGIAGAEYEFQFKKLYPKVATFFR